MYMSDTVSNETHYPPGHKSGLVSSIEYYPEKEKGPVSSTTYYPPGHKSRLVSSTNYFPEGYKPKRGFLDRFLGRRKGGKKAKSKKSKKAKASKKRKTAKR
jgi:hypothetical protein